MERTTKYSNEVVKIVPRLYEIYDTVGIWLNFEKNEDPLLNTIWITFKKRDKPFNYFCFLKLPNEATFKFGLAKISPISVFSKI